MAQPFQLRPGTPIVDPVSGRSTDEWTSKADYERRKRINSQLDTLEKEIKDAELAARQDLRRWESTKRHAEMLPPQTDNSLFAPPFKVVKSSVKTQTIPPPSVVGRRTQTSPLQTADVLVQTTPPPVVVSVACQTDPEVPSEDGTSQIDGNSKTHYLSCIYELKSRFTTLRSLQAAEFRGGLKWLNFAL